MSAIKGFSSDTKIKDQKYLTLQPTGAGKVGADMLPKAVYEISAGLIPEAGSTVDTIELAGNTAVEGNLIRFTAGQYQGQEVTVASVDGSTIELSHKFPNAITAADVFALHGYLTLTVGPDGSLSVSQGPIQILRGPNGVFATAEVTKDTANIANTIAMPVEIVGVDGTEINITAGDINVQTSDMGANFDSQRVGDGSGNYIAVSADQEAQVHDPKSLTALGLLATEANVAKEAKQDTIITALGTLATEATVAKEAKQDDQITALGLVSKEAKQDTQITRAEETRDRLPATLGSKADAASLSVTQSTEDKAVQDAIKTAVEGLASSSEDTTEDHYKRDFDTSPLTTASGWVSLRTLTASIKRISVTNNSGNELLIRNASTNKTIIVGAGASVNTSLIGVATNEIEIQAITADATSGIIYLNFEG